MKIGSAKEAAKALKFRDDIIGALREAYASAAREDAVNCAKKIQVARDSMNLLLAECESLAKKNIGVPFFEGL